MSSCPSSRSTIEPLSAAVAMLAGATRVMVSVTTPLADADGHAPADFADRAVWRNLLQVGTWRAPVKSAEPAHSQWARQQTAAAPARRPGTGHLALARLQARIPDCRTVTVATDLLLEIAGVTPVWHLNGHVPGEQCAQCAAIRATPAHVSADVGAAPCERCGGTLRPWPAPADAATPNEAWLHALRTLRQCEAMLWVADEDFVYPAAEFAKIAMVHGAKLILVSRTPTGLDAAADVTLRGEPEAVLAALADGLDAR